MAYAEAKDWLMVIDMQHAFSRPGSRWEMDSYAATRAAIESIVPVFGDRVVWTRFVAPAEAEGSWRSYYERWPEFASPAGSDWDLDIVADAAHTVTAHTFSKWVPDQLPAELLAAGRVVLVGVAYDCCVLATALAAIDAGSHVTVVTDAVGASSDALASATSTILRHRAPQLAFTDVQTILQRETGARAVP